MYSTSACVAGIEALETEELDMSSMIAKLRKIRYLSTLVVTQLDLKCLTFFNVNTPAALKKAEHLLKSTRHSARSEARALSSFTAQTLNSGILALGSSAAIVSLFAAASAK